MSEIKVNSIKGVGASAAAITVNNTDGTCTANITNRTNKNIIVNGACLIAQRGTSSTTAGYQTVDRFKITFSGTDEAPTQAQVDVAAGTTPYTSGFRKALRVTNGNQTGGAGADDNILIDYRIESQDIVNTGWNYKSASSFITLSFWVKSSIQQEFHGFLLSQTGGNYLYSFSTGTLIADTWTKVTKTISGNSNLNFDNSNASGLLIRISPFQGTNKTGTITQNQWAAFNGSIRYPNYTSTWYEADNATFELTGVQFEVGSVATDFEHRSFGQELALCQRYFNMHADGTALSTIGLCGSNGTYVFPVITFPVTMRAAPSLYLVTGSNYFIIKGGVSIECQVIAANVTSIHTMEIVVTVSTTSGDCYMVRTNNSAARLGFSAEL